MEENYVLVRWPESQEFMECDWFRDEAILALGSEDVTGSSAYFIPESRILDNSYIEQRVVDLCRNYEVSPESEEYANKQWENTIPYEGGMSLSELLTETALLVRKRSSVVDDKKYDGEE